MKGRKTLCLLLAALCLVQAASALEVTVDGEPLAGEAFLSQGTTYVQMTALLEALGGWETWWDAPSRSAVAHTDRFRLTVPADSRQVLADGYAYDLPAAVLLRSGRTYVPLRTVSNLLGAEVTWRGADLPVAVRRNAGRAYTQEDLDWLSRIISAESRGESLTGQVAVGNVVLNRAASEKFPDTIREVIFDKKDAVQFEPVANGTVYDEPAASSVLAARLALEGAEAVPGDCLYFFAPALSQGTWIRQNCVYYTTIGCHQFYREP